MPSDDLPKASLCVLSSSFGAMFPWFWKAAAVYTWVCKTITLQTVIQCIEAKAQNASFTPVSPKLLPSLSRIQEWMLRPIWHLRLQPPTVRHHLRHPFSFEHSNTFDLPTPQLNWMFILTEECAAQCTYKQPCLGTPTDDRSHLGSCFLTLFWLFLRFPSHSLPTSRHKNLTIPKNNIVSQRSEAQCFVSKGACYLIYWEFNFPTSLKS